MKSVIPVLSRHWLSIVSAIFAILLQPFSWLPISSVQHARAQTNDRAVMIVLDGSGSMWGKLGQSDKTKLELSQTLLTDALKKANMNVSLGLSSFGHRRAGNCSDADVIFPPAPGNAPNLIGYIEKHNPRGKGPLTLALRKTIASMPADKPGTIVLIHDGYDNCRQDPCAVADEISKSHPRVVVHTISLDLPKQTVQAMACLSQKTNGTAHSAATEADYAAAVKSLKILATLTPPQPAKPPPQTALKDSDAVKQGPPRIRLTAALDTSSPAPLRSVHWRVAKADQPNQIILNQTAATLAAQLAPGSYIVNVTAGLAKSQSKITVPKQGEVQQNFALHAGVLEFDTKASLEPGARDADPPFVSISTHAAADTSAAPARPLWIGQAKTGSTLVLPAGDYALEIERTPSSKQLPVTVKAGAVTAIDAALEQDGLLILNSTIQNAEATDPAASPTHDGVAVSYILRIDDPSVPGGRRELARSAAPNAEFIIPPGTVYVEARLGQAVQEQRFALGQGQTVQHTFQFNVATVELDTVIGSNPLPETLPVRYRVVRVQVPSGESPLTVTTSQHAPRLVLPVGTYQIEAEVAGRLIGKSGPVTVASGADKTIQVALNAGQIVVQPAANNYAATPMRFQIRTTGGEIVWRGRAGRTALTTVLEPGDYTLETRQSPVQKRGFTVDMGATTVVALPSRP